MRMSHRRRRQFTKKVCQQLQKGDLATAHANFEKVLRIAPRSPEGHNSLGWVLLAEGKIDLAIAQFRTALKLHPEFALAHMNLANALVQKGDLPSALREAQESTRLAPADSAPPHIFSSVLHFFVNLTKTA